MKHRQIMAVVVPETKLDPEENPKEDTKHIPAAEISGQQSQTTPNPLLPTTTENSSKLRFLPFFEHIWTRPSVASNEDESKNRQGR